jgi:hypothetical protein
MGWFPLRLTVLGGSSSNWQIAGMTMPNIALRNAVPSGNSLQQISTMLHCHFALFALSNSCHPSSALTISYLTARPFSSTLSLTRSNSKSDSTALAAERSTFASWLRQRRKALDLT